VWNYITVAACKNTIQSSTYWSNLKKIQEKVEPIHVALNRSQGVSNANLSNVFVDWTELSRKYLRIPAIARIFDEKWKLIECDLFQASVLLDPRFVGRRASELPNYDNLTDDEKQYYQPFMMLRTHRKKGEKALKNQCNLLFPKENENNIPALGNGYLKRLSSLLRVQENLIAQNQLGRVNLSDNLWCIVYVRMIVFICLFHRYSS
jgi:hypothetical protein